MSVLKRGRGQPRTLFAPGGTGENLDARMQYASSVAGTKIGFVYEQSGLFERVAHIRRQADRDAAEVRELAKQQRTTQAIGFSRGARALVGALKDDVELFERVALVIPPMRLRVAQNYELWLDSLTPGGAGLSAEILVIGHTGDRGHPASEAEAWAEQLGARLEMLPSRTVSTDPDQVDRVLADFFNSRLTP